MSTSQSPLRRLSLSAFFVALIVGGLAAGPVAAQQRCAVSPQRGQQLVARYHQYGAEKVRIAGRYRALNDWCQRNWHLSHTLQYQSYQGEMRNLHARYNWVRYHMDQIQAEYYGRSYGWVAGGGSSTGSTPSTTSTSSTGHTTGSSGPVRILGQSAGPQRPTVTPQGTSGGPNFNGLNLLNQRVQGTGR